MALILMLMTLSLFAQNATVVVPGDSDWIDTGFSFNIKSKGIVFASGYVVRKEGDSHAYHDYATPAGRAHVYISTSNASPCHSCNATSLIGRLGPNGKPFLIGKRCYINSQDKRAKKLYLRVNDNPLYDNQGAFVAIIYTDVDNICTGNPTFIKGVSPKQETQK